MNETPLPFTVSQINTRGFFNGFESFRKLFISFIKISILCPFILSTEILIPPIFFSKHSTDKISSVLAKEVTPEEIQQAQESGVKSKSTTKPGLTDQGQPTSKESESVPKEQIEADDNFGFIEDFLEGI